MEHRLVYYGNETLKRVAGEITNIDQEIIDLIEPMYTIMYNNNGIGLAAPQIDIAKRIIVIDIQSYSGQSVALLNPVIKEFSDALSPYDEGCLSLPGISAEIIRPTEVLVAAVDLDGKEVQFEANGLFARVLQHEIDHLNGKVFIDHLEEYQREELRKQLKKIKKMNRE